MPLLHYKAKILPDGHLPLPKDYPVHAGQEVDITVAPLPSGNGHDETKRFQELAARWRAETAHLSSATAIAMHPAYQQIIGLGAAVLPMILLELEREPEHWFWALKAIAGTDPVPPAYRGRIPEMREAWLRWARDQGIRW